MLKKTRSTVKSNNQPSLKNLLQKSCKKDSSSDLKHLFLPQKREIFQLAYLFNSPHFNQDPSYTQLVKLIDNYNDQTLQIQESKSLSKEISRFNKVKLTCMRLLYRELLSIAVMSEKEVKKCNLAGKLKDWYYSLGDHHSFLEGVNFKKRKESILERQIEEDIRSTYVSNVYDEIDDYMRKKIDYSSENKKDSFHSDPIRAKHKREENDISLPLIDLLIYKREDARLREAREKEYDQCYLKTMLKNKTVVRQNSLLKLKKISNLKPKAKQEDQQDKNNTTFATQQNFYPSIGRQSIFQLKPLKTKLGWYKSKQNQNDRLNLSNINGINLISCKIQ